MIRRTLAGCATAVLVLGAGVAEGARWPSWASDAADDSYLERFADADSVIALDEWDITVRKGARTGTRRWVVHVVTEDGTDDALLKLARGHFGGFDDVRMWVLDPSGRTVKYSDEDGSLFSLLDRKVLDDTEILALRPPAVRPGTKVAVEARFSRTAELPQDLFYVQREIPIARSAIRVQTPDSWNVAARVSRGDHAYGFRESGLEWQFTDVPGRAFESGGYSDQPPLVFMALNYSAPGTSPPFGTWAQVCSWGRELYDLSSSGSDAVLTLAAGLPREPSRAVDAAGKLTRELRYFGVELGWGGLIPRPAATTLHRGFGDCKDKAHLMISLLRAVGVEAYPTWIVARSDRHVPEDVPSPNVFNHVVVAIPWSDAVADGMMVVDSPEHGRLRIYDATMSDRSAQDVSPRLEGAAALVLHPDTTRLLNLPDSGPLHNALERSHEWSFGAYEGLSGRTRFRFRGALRLMLEGDGGEWLEPSEVRDDTRESLAEALPHIYGLEVSEVSEDEDGAWSYEAAYRANDVLGESGALRSLQLGELLSHDVIPLPSSEKPESSRYLPFLGTFRETFLISFPGHRLVGGQQSVDTTTTVGRARCVLEMLPDGVRVQRELELTDRELTAEDRDAALELRGALREINNQVLVFEATR